MHEAGTVARSKTAVAVLWGSSRSLLHGNQQDSAARQLEFAAGRGTTHVAAQRVLGRSSVGRCDEPVFPARMGVALPAG